MAWAVSSNAGLRRWEILAFAALACAGCLLILFPPGRFPFYPICPFHALTGLLCPGCGGTRAMAALLRGHMAEAWHRNALVVSLTPLAIIAGLVRLQRGVWPAMPHAVWLTLATTTAVFTIARNL